jgi:enoyl-CoA hydratase/carnithine racemase
MERNAKVRVEREGDVAVLVIDNPPINAGSTEVRRGLLEGVRAAQADSGVRAVVILGAGTTFVAGSDLREFGRPLEEPQLPAVIAAIEACDKPFVAALHGAALGGGFELALGCDARVASPGTIVGLPEVTLGVIPGYGGTQRLARLVGEGPAAEILMTGRKVTAEEALRIGLVNRVVEPGALLDACTEILDQTYKAGPVAVRSALEALHRGAGMTLEDGCAYEATMFGLVCGTEDAEEGCRAFLEKRKAEFRGK